ncbi:MAG: hypothetical protein AAGG75_22330 [Bacteroidota bacterium]
MNTGKLKLELIWWIFTGLLAFAILFPIINSISSYPFLTINVVFIIVFITSTRYIFLLKHTFVAQQQIIKAIIIVISIPLIFYLVNNINYFQTFLDEEGIDAVIEGLNYEKGQQMAGYIRNEMLLFGVGSLIASVMLPFRMLISIWRTRNRGTV